uniref:NADP-dependent oxidoreductase domain-containing protein n=2 Tax=Clastoptera arizonana TaxID=38151 RepID=A0A1B6CHW2_9HEMI
MRKCFFSIITYLRVMDTFKEVSGAYQGVSDLLSKHKVLSSKYCLNSGTSMPILGFGTYQIRSHQIYETLDTALGCGYTNIDTAAVYYNEEAIGQALKDLLPKYGLQREDIFITTKLSPRDVGKSRVNDAVKRALQNLNTDYIDLFLIHWPGAQGIGTTDSQNPRLRMETWLELIDLHNKGNGVLRAIGVSNFMTHHLEQIITLTGVPPAVNQIEFHPYYLHPKELYEVCAKHNILLQAYSSLGGTGNPTLIQNATIEECAKKHCVSPAQVLLRWALQAGYAIIPKSITPDKIRMNAKLDFELTNEEMNLIFTLNKKFNEKFAWDPVNVM